MANWSMWSSRHAYGHWDMSSQSSNKAKLIPSLKKSSIKWIQTGSKSLCTLHVLAPDFSRLGYLSFEDYMAFMVSRETDNIESIAEVLEAFRAIASERENSYVTEEELQQVKLLSLIYTQFCSN